MFQQGQASLTIGGQPAVIEYAGAARYQIWGIPRINALVPAGLAPGPQPVVLTIGRNSTASQQTTVYDRLRWPLGLKCNRQMKNPAELKSRRTTSLVFDPV